MMRHDRNEPTNERLDRYADAIYGAPWNIATSSGMRRVRRSVARAVMAVADAEQADIRARWNVLREAIAKYERDADFQLQQRLKAEARAERAKALLACLEAPIEDRAEAAEAEVERLRAEIRDRESERADLRDRVQKAEAQVARVEALADDWERTTVHRWPSAEVRAALEEPK